MKLVNFAKRVSKKTGSYRQAQWVFRNIIRPRASTFYQKEIAFYSNLFGPGDLCFDVGASVGRKSEVFLKIGASVVAFEPQADSFEELKNRCDRFNEFLPVQSAMGPEIGTVEMYIRELRSTSSVRNDWEGDVVSTIQVPMTTLDASFEKYGKPKFCKIDVEGYEIDVLQGLSSPIEIISFEYHVNEINKVVECLKYLRQMGTLKINITPAEQSYFAFPVWQHFDQFLQLLETELSGKQEYGYGDIFVKMSN